MAISTPNINFKFVNENGQATQAFFLPYSELIKFVNEQPVTLDFAGSPEGNVTARFKDQCWDTINEKLYFKSTATGNTGWVALN
jgi:hypothetical protein